MKSLTFPSFLAEPHAFDQSGAINILSSPDDTELLEASEGHSADDAAEEIGKCHFLK